jgi:hypothetical protein
MTDETGDFRMIIVNGVQHRDRGQGAVGVLAEILSRLKASPSCSKLITAEETEMPRSRSTAIQSERTLRLSPRAFTSPASCIAPPNSKSFSVKVVLPASGCER